MSSFNQQGGIFKKGKELDDSVKEMVKKLKVENSSLSYKELVVLIMKKCRISRNTAKKYVNNVEKKKRGRKKFSGKKLTIPVIEFILLLTITMPFLFLKEIQSRIYDKFEFSPVISEIKRIRDDLGYTRKKIEYVNFHRKLPYVQELRRKFRSKARFFDPDSLIFIDEMSFHFRDMEAEFGYSEKGKACKCFQNHLSRESFSLICAMSSKKIIHFAIYKTTGFGVTHNEFFHFICGLLPKIEVPKWKIIMDNAANHKHSLCKMLYSNLNVDIEWLPPYSPEYNPIENLFG